MSEIWNSSSSIEEKHSITLTPQINQFKQNFNMRYFDGILKKLYNWTYVKFLDTNFFSKLKFKQLLS